LNKLNFSKNHFLSISFRSKNFQQTKELVPRGQNIVFQIKCCFCWMVKYWFHFPL